MVLLYIKLKIHTEIYMWEYIVFQPDIKDLKVMEVPAVTLLEISK